MNYLFFYSQFHTNYLPFPVSMSAYALGRTPSAPIVRVEPVQLRPRTLVSQLGSYSNPSTEKTDLSASFCVGRTAPVPNTPTTYRLRSFPYRTFRQSRLDDVHYTDQYFIHSTQFRPFPLIERYDRRFVFFGWHFPMLYL